MKYIINLVLIAFLVSCGTVSKEKEMNKSTLYNKWELSILNGEQVKVKQPIYIQLNEDKTVSGFIGCNRITGTFSVENKSNIKFNQLATTRMACPEMKLENNVLKLLNTANSFTIKNGKLTLNTSNTLVATFYKMSDNKIVNKYWKLKKLEGNSIQMAANQEREQYFILKSDGSITGFAGCNHFNGNYELAEGNRISIQKNMAVTLKACPNVIVNESAFLKVFELADNYTINGDTLNLNVGKRAPLAIFEAVYF